MKVVTLYRTKDERRQDIPRVDLNRVDFEVDEAAGILRITLDYTIRRKQDIKCSLQNNGCASAMPFKQA